MTDFYAREAWPAVFVGRTEKSTTSALNIEKSFAVQERAGLLATPTPW